MAIAGISDADLAALNAFKPSDLNLNILERGIGPTSGAGVYYGESKTFTAPTSNKGNATSTLNSGNTYAVTPDSAVTVVDNATGKVVYSGIGYDAAAKANEVAQGLSDAGGNKATWDIMVNTPGMEAYGSGSGPVSVAHEKVNLTTGQIATMALNAAAQIGVAVATAGMSVPAQAAIAAGTSAALTIAEGGSVGDAIKAGVMSAAPALGAGYLGPAIQSGTNAAGKVVATTLGKTVAAGASSTLAGLATGQNVTQALTSGAISAAGQILAAELASSKPDELMQWASDNGIFEIQAGAANIDAALNHYAQIAAGTRALGGVSSVDFGPAAASTFVNAPQATAGVSDGAETIVNAPRVTTPSNVNVPAGAVSGLANAVQQAVSTDELPEKIVNAQDQPAPLYEVPAATPNAGIGGLLSPEIIATAQSEAAVPAEDGAQTAGIGGNFLPDLTSTAQRDAATTTKETTTPAVTGNFLPDLTSTGQRDTVTQTDETAAGVGGNFLPDLTSTAQRDAVVSDDNGPLSVNMTDIGDLINSDDFQKEIAEEEADKDDKSILDIAKDVAQVVGAVAAVGGAVAGSGGGGGGGGGDNGPGITFNPTVLTPTIPGTGGTGGTGGIGGTGSRYPYTPTSYGRVGGDQETEYVFFNQAPATPAAAPAAVPAAVPAAAGGRKEGGEIHDDMVKHLVEYRKGGGHQGPGKVTGIGSGQEDLIPAWLSDGEYVWSAQDVADLGDGSTDEGVRRLDKMRQMVRKQAGRKDVKKIAKPQKGIDTMLKAVGGQA